MHTLGLHEHGYRGNEPLEEERRTISSADFGEVVREIVSDIGSQAWDRSVLDRDLFDSHFYLWEDGSGAEDPRQSLTEIVADDRQLTRLLEAYSQRSMGVRDGFDGKSLGESPPRLRVRLLENFELIEDAKGRAGRLLEASSKWLSDADRTLLEAFITFYAEDEVAR